MVVNSDYIIVIKCDIDGNSKLIVYLLDEFLLDEFFFRNM